MQIASTIASELGVRPQQVEATINLLNEGATVPFIARYRKEVTGGLDDTQLRTLHERLGYLRELEDRREAILKSIEEQGKLDDALRRQIMSADTKQRLEDLYAPFKPKRRTKGQIAIEAGLEPLADALLANPNLDPEAQATSYIDQDAGFADEKAVLEGARYILMERFAEIPDLVGQLRQYMWHHGFLRTVVIEEKAEQGVKFADYFDFAEALKRIPSHRVLAMLRGQNEDVLRLDVVPDQANLDDAKATTMEAKIARHVGIEDRGRAADTWLNKVVRWTWKVKLHNQLSTDLLSQVRERAEEEAIRVFARNLKDLLMAAPAGRHVTMGLDPGLRTGVKVVVVDDTGKLVDQSTIYPHAPQNRWDASLEILARLCQKHRVSLIAIGNGTASRETDKLASDLIAQNSDLKMSKIMVSEAGASVYSASQLAADEFPDLDVSIRGAVSIARRLQDPLAELVKIDPKSIGVGQYQHDVNQTRLAHMLDAVVEDCVNAVGVDLNTASEPLLRRVSGLTPSLAQNIVAFRNDQGRFVDRKQLLKVSRLGPKAFEQCAGFLRIREGKNPLDTSAVHPEAYPLVERILRMADATMQRVMGNRDLLASFNPQTFVSDQFGLPTVHDILKELEKPGRDPRGEFKTATFADGVEKLSDLVAGMTLEGVVTNVTNFGAFVDVGVHQDGLVHISQLANHFVSDPHQVVKAGQIVNVRVMEVDIKRKRISLSMRSEEAPQQRGPKKKDPKPRSQAQAQTTMAAAFSKSKGRR